MTFKRLALPGGAEVSAARDNIRGVAIRSPLLKLQGGQSGLGIYLKLENLQPWGSFKLRPALNALKLLDPKSLSHGVLSASSGNFGQGLAFAAQRLGVPATLVVPEQAAQTKVNALIELGTTVIRLPFEQWWTVLSTRHCPGQSGVFVHPVAENAVLAGNATIGMEILEDLPDVDAVAVPFGGGGLICGIGSVMRRLKPQVRMIAVESQAAQPAAAALRAGRPVTVPHQQSFVDGMGSITVLEPMWPLVEQMVDSAASVSFTQITDAVRFLAQRHHVIAEAAGAASLAAATAGQAGKGNIVCIISGGNIDPPKLAAILNGQNPF